MRKDMVSTQLRLLPSCAIFKKTLTAFFFVCDLTYFEIGLVSDFHVKGNIIVG